jgi:integrase
MQVHFGYRTYRECRYPMKLTDTAVRKAKPGPKPNKIGDGKGMFLLVTTSGSKLWRFQYRYKGKPKLISLGAYPEVSLATAREKLLEARALLAKDVDPSAARQAAKHAHTAKTTTFENVFLDWLTHWQDGKSPRHVDYVERRVKADILPRIGQLPIAEIEAPTVVSMLKAIQDRGVRDIAKRAYETTGQIFRYAVAHGHAKRNPCADFKPSDVLKSGVETNYARIDAKELPAFLQALEVYPGTHVTRLAIWFMALTFVRTSELINTPWTEFDFDAARWNIPAERMKMRTPHIVPLSLQAIETLQTLQRLTGHTKWLLPGDHNPKKPMSNNTILKGIERIGYKGRMTGHGFRGLASTTLHEKGYDHAHIELQLAHAPRNAVSAAYNHALYLEPRAKMMQD